MQKNIFFVVFCVGILLLILVYAFFQQKPGNITETPVDILPDNNTETTQIADSYSLNSAITAGIPFNQLLDKIIEDFNFHDLLVGQFSKIESVEQFSYFEYIFGRQLILFVALKEKNLEMLHKYNTLNCKANNCDFPESEVSVTEQKVISSLKEKGYYDGEYTDPDGSLDLVFLSVANKTTLEKIAICQEKLPKDSGSYRICMDAIYYMASSKDEQFCEKIIDPLFVRLCKDTYR